MFGIKTLKTLFFSICTFCLVLSIQSSYAYEGDVVKGKEKSASCAACHSADGNSVNPIWPTLAGQHKKYLVKQLEEFRKGPQGKRNNGVMYGMALVLTDEDIQDLSAYFAEQKITPAKARADLMELGQKIYRAGDVKNGVPACSGCHGVHGEGNSLAGFPSLSYQHAEYTLQQLKDFKMGVRKNSPNSIMAGVASTMNEEQMQAVSSYVQGLH